MELYQQAKIISAIDQDGDTWVSVEPHINRIGILVEPVRTLYTRIRFDDGTAISVPTACIEILTTT